MYATLTIEGIDYTQEVEITPEQQYLELSLWAQQCVLSVEENLSTVVAEFFIADYVKGDTPFIGENGNWWIGTEDTGVKAEGQDGYTPIKGVDYFDGATPTIGENKHWYIDGVDTGILAEGTDGDDGTSSVLTIGENGNFYINGIDTGQKAQGNDGIGVSNFELISVVDKVKTYRMSFTNSTYVDIPITDGEDGTNGKTAYEYAVEGGYTGTEAAFTLLFNSIDDHISDETIHHTTEELNAAFEPKNSNIQQHIEDSNIHVSETQKTNIDKLDLSSELAAGEAIDETNDKIPFWNNSASKIIMLGWARLKGFVDTYFIRKDQTTKQTLTSSPIISDMVAGQLVYVAADKSLKPIPKVVYDAVKEQLQLGNVSVYNSTYGLAVEKRIISYDSIIASGGNAVLSVASIIATRATTLNIGNVSTSASAQIAFVNKNDEFMRVNNANNVGFKTTTPKAVVDINGGCKIGDDTDAASADKLHTFRGRLVGTNADVLEFCMKEGADSYRWVEVQRTTW